MGDASYVTHAVMMVTHALAVTSLPVRIARSEVRRALFSPLLGPYLSSSKPLSVPRLAGAVVRPRPAGAGGHGRRPRQHRVGGAYAQCV